MAIKKILCIDDSINLLRVLKKRFEFDIPQVKVITCSTGEEGIAAARTECPDVIILDIMMPKMDGDEVLNKLRNPKNLSDDECDTSNIPVMVLTAHGPEERSKYLAMGASDYMSSPFDTAELVSKVKDLLGLTA